MVVSYLNFVFFIEVKAKSKYRILKFVFQFIKKMKWHFGYTDWFTTPLFLKRLVFGECQKPPVYKSLDLDLATSNREPMHNKDVRSRKNNLDFFRKWRLVLNRWCRGPGSASGNRRRNCPNTYETTKVSCYMYIIGDWSIALWL